MCDASLLWCDCVIYGFIVKTTHVKLMLHVVKNANFYIIANLTTSHSVILLHSIWKKFFFATYKNNVHINLYNFLLKQTRRRACISNLMLYITLHFSNVKLLGKKSQYLFLRCTFLLFAKIKLDRYSWYIYKALEKTHKMVLPQQTWHFRYFACHWTGFGLMKFCWCYKWLWMSQHKLCVRIV